MKIRWQKETRSVATGYVGEIACFEISKMQDKYELRCELPDASPIHHGRLITHHATPREAQRAAMLTLQHWVKRFTA